MRMPRPGPPTSDCITPRRAPPSLTSRRRQRSAGIPSGSARTSWSVARRSWDRLKQASSFSRHRCALASSSQSPPPAERAQTQPRKSAVWPEEKSTSSEASVPLGAIAPGKKKYPAPSTKWTCSRKRRGASISYRSRNAMPDPTEKAPSKRPASVEMSEIRLFLEGIPVREATILELRCRLDAVEFRRRSPGFLSWEVAFRYDGPMGDLATLQEKQAEAARFATEMAEEKDTQRLQQMAEQIQARCAELG